MVEAGDGPVPDTAEEHREVVPTAAATQYLGGRRIAEDARGVLCEDLVAGERPQKAVERVGVGACVAGQLGHRSRSVCEPVCDTELGDDCQCTRAERSA